MSARPNCTFCNKPMVGAIGIFCSDNCAAMAKEHRNYMNVLNPWTEVRGLKTGEYSWMTKEEADAIRTQGEFIRAKFEKSQRLQVQFEPHPSCRNRVGARPTAKDLDRVAKITYNIRRYAVLSRLIDKAKVIN